MSVGEGETGNGKKQPGSRGCLIAVVVLAVAFGYFVLQIALYDPHQVKSVRKSDGYDAVRFELVNNEVVLLIGVGMPPAETRDAARDAVAGLIQGKHIRIETDQEKISAEKRLLSYVYAKVKGGQQGLDNLLRKLGLPTGKVKVNADGEVFINELVVRLGLAASTPTAPNLKHREELEAAQEAAKKEGLGMWGGPASRGESR